ncbi:MAG: hypothetical protein L0G81_15300, partial [Ewingella sp.]|nr:hypothetical protein [Ewingella sp.]
MRFKAIFLTTLFTMGVANAAFADSCQKNIFDGYDCTYDNGTTSTSQKNIFGGLDTRYSDGRSSSSQANIFG